MNDEVDELEIDLAAYGDTAPAMPWLDELTS